MFDDPINSPSPLIRRVEKALRANQIIRSQFVAFFKGDIASLTIPAYSKTDGIYLKIYTRLDADDSNILISGKRLTEQGKPQGFFEKASLVGIRRHQQSVATLYNNRAGDNPQIMIMGFESSADASNAHDVMKHGYA